MISLETIVSLLQKVVVVKGVLLTSSRSGSRVFCFQAESYNNKHYTPDWNNDKPCEWDLETLIGQTFVKNKKPNFFWCGEL